MFDKLSEWPITSYYRSIIFLTLVQKYWLTLHELYYWMFVARLKDPQSEGESSSRGGRKLGDDDVGDDVRASLKKRQKIDIHNSSEHVGMWN